jgi:hypothetical protein
MNNFNPLKKSLAVLTFVASLITFSLYAIPDEYRDQENKYASAEELNMIYASLPQSKGDKFVVLSSARVTNILKFYVVQQMVSGVPAKYFILSTSPTGCTIYYKGKDEPFLKGVIPDLKGGIPLQVLNELAIPLSKIDS